MSDSYNEIGKVVEVKQKKRNDRKCNSDSEINNELQKQSQLYSDSDGMISRTIQHFSSFNTSYGSQSAEHDIEF
ncbi:hypothetical protein H5410_007612 [Solanum commersonii]|uniref:Uncharacterized protein n=1 Tax=Solanum commersonii TaxID=4109 RepID=A0A9J6AE30_SOLCO|nr:hypothetical protein H5410_007612 [Solanum commersonii]